MITVIVAGQVWTPTLANAVAKPRTVVWVGRAPDAKNLRHLDHLTVGWVHDSNNPNFPETGHDSWTSIPGFRAWIRKYHAKCL